ncbi:MAG: hypothetical protein FJX77_04350, partial [Armatimonadetes bacterium]|nr:hypothetical protein [Armatimonadota bacterium]
LFTEERREARTAAQYRALLAAELGGYHRLEARGDALRRLKRREFLRIGWRDLGRGAPLEETVQELSDLADSLIQGALQLAREELDPRFPTAAAAVQFTILAMGKLGARELNYSSDVDLMFVTDGAAASEEGPRRYATRLAERVTALLGETTGEGRCFRVDLRLRPEGRSGPLVRSLAGYRAYYDRWAETWERQALIKVRPVAGDPALGERFLALVRPAVYRRLQGPSLLEDVREMRSAVERKLAAAGEMEIYVKEGRGTIRDVEFTVQLLQLLFGSDHPQLQVADTLTALERLEPAGCLAAEERAILEAGYRFFRVVEHRLQIFEDLPVRLVPEAGPALERLGRSLGYPNGAGFQEAYRAHSEAVRSRVIAIQARLGITPASKGQALWEALVSADTEAGLALLRSEVAARSFPDPDAACEALVRLSVGRPRDPHPAGTRRLFADAGARVLEADADAADPTQALEGLAAFAERSWLFRALYQSWNENPAALERLARFAGTAPVALPTLLRWPEFADQVTDEGRHGPPFDPTAMGTELQERLASTSGAPHRLALLKRLKAREFLRASARHVLLGPDPEAETRAWSALTDLLVRVALAEVLAELRAGGRWPGEAEPPFAVLALGRLGGNDLHLASDLDLLYLHSAAPGYQQQHYELLARRLGEVLQSVTEEGRLYEVDLRLRPEGRQGWSVPNLEGLRRYYGEGGRGQTWEFQMLTRCRYLAGDSTVADEFLTEVLPRVYRDPMPAEWEEEIRRMKRRIERERVAEAERERHLKLGPGGLSDIEFTVQFLQLREGGLVPHLRCTSTRAAIRALQERGHLTAEGASALHAGHAYLTRLRQSLYLLASDRSSDLLPGPDEPRLGAALARVQGLSSVVEVQEQYRAITAPVRTLLTSYL